MGYAAAMSWTEPIGLSALAAATASAQQAFPVKPIRCLVAYPAGGSTDPMARTVTGTLRGAPSPARRACRPERRDPR